MANNGWTPQESMILGILSDGMPHEAEELRHAIDPLAERQVVAASIFRMRKKLPKGEIIVCENDGRKTHYRHARLLVVQ